LSASEIRDRAVRPAPDFVSLNPGYVYFLGNLDRAGAQFWIEAYQLIVGTRK
jgi:hypothetical protein